MAWRVLAFAALAGLIAAAGPARADDGMRFWTSVFAGRSSLSGDAAKGTQDVRASMISNLFGADSQIDDYNLVGASLGLSHQTFSATGGHGHSNDVALTLYGRHFLTQNIYIAESLGYGWHDVDTSRTVRVLLDETLTAAYRATDIGGRLEAGYSFPILADIQLAPFTAVVGDAYSQPAYRESSSLGSSIFGVNYAAATFGVTHLEWGARAGRKFTIGDGVLSTDALAAYEYELDGSPLILASFQSFPGTYLALRGTSPAKNSALLGAGLRYQEPGGPSFGLRADTRLGPGTTIMTGTLDIAWHW